MHYTWLSVHPSTHTDTQTHTYTSQEHTKKPNKALAYFQNHEESVRRVFLPFGLFVLFPNMCSITY